MSSAEININHIEEKLIKSWIQPNPNFGAGRDKRSSESGLLELLFGSLETASRFQWLNGGRTLVDKTWLRIFWESQQFEKPAITFDEMASRLDSFIREHLVENWQALNQPDHEIRQQQVLPWIEAIAKNIFGSQPNYVAACSLLFYLLPQLDITPLTLHHSHKASISDIEKDLQKSQQQLSKIDCQLPEKIIENAAENIKPFLKNWWQRRVAFEIAAIEN